MPGLAPHNPHVDWRNSVILSWSQSCHVSCLGAASSGSVSSVFQVSVADLTGVPVEYGDLHQVFSKARATSLPPHWSYDCAIDLLPGTSPPKDPERERLWTVTLMTPFMPVSSVPPPLLRGQVSFLLRRGTAPCVRASITEVLMTLLQRIGTPCL